MFSIFHYETIKLLNYLSIILYKSTKMVNVSYVTQQIRKTPNTKEIPENTKEIGTIFNFSDLIY